MLPRPRPRMGSRSPHASATAPRTDDATRAQSHSCNAQRGVRPKGAYTAPPDCAEEFPVHSHPSLRRPFVLLTLTMTACATAPAAAVHVADDGRTATTSAPTNATTFRA